MSLAADFVPRYYQTEAVNAVWNHLRNKTNNPCIELPTGAGKSPTMAMICRDAVQQWGGRVLVLADQKELIEQNAEKIFDFLPDGITRGIYSAGLNSRDTDSQVLVAGIQSVYKRACELGAFDLILVDEAHGIPASGEGRYRTFLADAKVVCPHVRVIGLTATPYRLKGGLICTPENILNEICYSAPVGKLIDEGFLCKLFSGEANAKYDTSSLSDHMIGNDFDKSFASMLMEDEEKVALAVEEILKTVADTKRRKTLIFCQSINHSKMVADALREHGIECGEVYGETKANERAETVDRFRTGELRYLVNVNVLTTGFDVRDIDCIVMLRATASPGLFYQMCGRGLRIHPDKDYCRILDFAENIVRHGPIDAIKPPGTKSKGSGNGESPLKQCPECGNENHISARNCTFCDFEFQFETTVKHDVAASNAPILVSQLKKPTITYVLQVVECVDYYEHTKRGADADHPKTMRVEYRCGFQQKHCEWVCVEHSGFAGQKARNWWNARSSEPMPTNAEEAANKAYSFKDPVVLVLKEAEGEKWPEIHGVYFEKDLDHRFRDCLTETAYCPECEHEIWPVLAEKKCFRCKTVYDEYEVTFREPGEDDEIEDESWSNIEDDNDWSEMEIPF